MEMEKVNMKKDFVKIRFEADDNLYISKILKFNMLAVIVRFVFEEDSIIHKFF